MITFDGQVRLAGDVRAFAQNWFNLLSDHEPLARLLPMVVDEGLEMVLPGRTLRSHYEFEDWYAVVGRGFVDQSYEIERVDARAEGDRIAVQVVVIWRATEVPDGRRVASRVTQQWRLSQDAESGELRISRYRVVDMTDI